ncbi:SMI1/KNR4 family protein [Streptomyces sp. NPDC093595]|uniref:SMI1/KNR4 family protein n=1 Tax=Streptomyces sp. NPDC093595 TaxID=3366045 RepID=UPI0037F276C4
MIETTGDDRRLPPALADLAAMECAYDEGRGIDFEPYAAFDSAEETTEWLRSWTGNPAVDGGAYRVFGQDGTGGLAALQLLRPGRPLVEQPVVFMGSEGACGVVAGNLSDFLWVLADGIGPMEAVEYDDRSSRPDAALTSLAEQHATTPRRPAHEIIAAARAEFPAYAEEVGALCR